MQIVVRKPAICLEGRECYAPLVFLVRRAHEEDFEGTLFPVKTTNRLAMCWSA